ncbi:MAG: tetratricopeptide repeat protein [bacterium]|nr:tetratricopeptide repeat protein [bacterium]
MAAQRAWRVVLSSVAMSSLVLSVMMAVMVAGAFFQASSSSAGRCFAAQEGMVADENSLYAVALGAYKDGFYDLAIDQFSHLLRLYPNSAKAPYAQFRIAESYFKQKNYDQSLIWYQKLLDQYPQKSDLLDKTLYRLGQIYFLKKEYEKADGFYQTLLDRCSGSRLAADALFWSAESKSLAGKWKEAKEAYQQVVKNYPNYRYAADALYGLGMAALKLQDDNQALKAFQEFTARKPQNKQQVVSAWLNIAEIEYRAGNYDRAAQHYQKIINDYPDSPEIRLALYGAGLSLYQIQQFSKAIALYQQFLAKYPKDELAEAVTFQIGVLHFKLENYSQAAEWLEKFIRTWTKSDYLPQASYYLALSNQKLGKMDLAKQQFSRIVKEFKESSLCASSWLQLGAMAYQAGQFTEAVRAYESASKASDRSVAAEALYWLGESWAGQKNYDQAIHAWLQLSQQQQYHGIDNWAAMAEMRVAGIYEHQGKVEKALELYEKVARGKNEDQLRSAARQRIEKLRSQIKKAP